MILVDTNVWIDFFKGKNDTKKLPELIEQDQVFLHPYVLTELVIGGLKKEIQTKLEKIQTLEIISEDKMRLFVIKENLIGKGLGLVDIHLLASARMNNSEIWTFDSVLKKIANQIL